MKTEKQNKKKENQELKEWKKPELKVLDKKGTENGGVNDLTEDYDGTLS
ncbi:MAG: hypothetical protein ACLFPH_07570 [Bacteroidales bacterium]